MLLKHFFFQYPSQPRENLHCHLPKTPEHEVDIYWNRNTRFQLCKSYIQIINSVCPSLQFFQTCAILNLLLEAHTKGVLPSAMHDACHIDLRMKQEKEMIYAWKMNL